MFGNTQYTLLDIQELYGYFNVEATIQALWKADARLFTYSTKDIVAYGAYKDLSPESIQETKKNSKIKDNSKFRVTMPPGLYRLSRRVLDHYFNYEKVKYIPKNSLDIIQPKIDSITINGCLNYDLYPKDVIVDESELFIMLGSPPPKDKKHPFYYAFDHTAEEWIAEYAKSYWIVAKDFSYFQISNQDRVELMGLKQELFKLIFHHHCDMHGHPFKSGDMMSKLETHHSYKGFSDFLSKNKDIKDILIKVNNKGIWRMKFPVFPSYIKEVIIPTMPKLPNEFDI